MKHSLLKRVLSLVLCLILLFTAVPLISIEAEATYNTEKDKAILTIVNANMSNFLSTRNSLFKLSTDNYELTKEIITKLNIGQWAAGNLTSVALSLVNPAEWLSVAANTVYQGFVASFTVAILNTGQEWVEEGKLNLNVMYNLYKKHNSNGKITDPDIARLIFKFFRYGQNMINHGMGYWSPYIEEVAKNGFKGALAEAFTEDLVNRAVTMNVPVGGTGLKLYDFYCDLGATSAGFLANMETFFGNIEQNLSTHALDIEGIDKQCKQFENTYSLSSCYATSTAFSNSTYYNSLRNVELSGNQRDDLVNIALSQVGYHEGNSVGQLNGANQYGNNNYTEYAYWFGREVKGNSYGHYYAWCAMFVSWCARQARIPTSVISNAAYARADGSSKKGGYSYFHVDYKNRGSYTPQAGDLIFFDNWSHVGIVYKVANGKVYTVEGNNDNSVKKTSYSLNSSYIQCYGVPKYNSTQSSVIENAYKYDYYNGASTYPIGTYKVKVNTSLTVRKGPSTNYGKISSYKNGDIVNVTATDGNWGYTGRGWICLDYTKFVSNAPSTYDSGVRYGTGNYVVTTPAGLNCRKGVGTSTGVIKTLPHGTQFSVTQTDGAWGYSPEHGGWLCLQYASYVSALTPSLPVPALPNLSTTTSSEIGVGEVISFKWDAVDTAEEYTVKLIDANTNEAINTLKVTGTNASFKAPYAGSFNVSVSAKNSQHEGPAYTLYGFSVKAPSTVTFKDWDGKVISTQSVGYGKDATAPTAPTRVGHTFAKWDGSYTKVREDRVVTATYTKNKYKVTFCDHDGTVLSTQDVYYGDAATAPSYSAPTGYSFVKWDSSFNNITKATTVKAVISWTSLYPLEISTNSAVQRNNKSYIVTSIVNNSPNKVSDARVIAVIKTKENKLLATVQSENLTLAKGEMKKLTLSASYDGMATKAELFVVKADDENIPLAKQLSTAIDQGTAWTSWSTSTPPADALKVETAKQYRYKDKKFTTSTSSVLDGWSLRTDVAENPKVDYGDWGDWSAWQDAPVASSDTVNVRTQVVTDYNSPIMETKYTYKTVYHYYHYSSQRTGATESDKKTTNCPNYYPFDSDVELTHYDYPDWCSPNPRYYYYYTAATPNTQSGKWTGVHKENPFTTQEVASSKEEIVGYNNKTQYSYQTRTKTETYYFYKWADNWSNWSFDSVAGNSNRKVETQTVYRYLANKASNIETTAGKFIERNGKVDTKYAGRYALLFVAEKSGVTQFVGQCQIGADGSYAFKFKTKDEPTVASGDYIVTLGIEGTTAAFELEPIKAPIPEYTVKFVDYDGTVVSTQKVQQGKDATAPAARTREGYKFIGWDKSYTNVQGNMTINAQYEIIVCEVVFVDEINDTSVVAQYNYGDKLTPPEITPNDAYNFLGWDAVIDGKTKVTENMVVAAKFEKKMLKVDFLDFDGSLLESKSIEYGDAVAESVLLNRDNYVFISWSPSSDLNYVTEDITVTPIFEYAETVLAPTANITTGAYNDELVVTLSTETEGAKIYYTTDGTVPNVPDSTFKAERNEFDLLEKSNGVLYTEPFTIDSSANLIYVAVKDGMNNSEISQEVYAVNTDESGEKQHLVNVHYNITGETISYLIDDGMLLSEFNMDLDENGYDLTGIYTDAEYKNTWNVDKDVVTESLDIYLKWEKETYSVKFIGFDGKVISEQSVRYMEDAVVPEITDVKGYVFKYWDTGYTNIWEDTTVTATYVSEDDVTSVDLDKTELTIIKGKKDKLNSSVNLGNDCTNDAVTWQSSNEDAIIVDDDGNITALNAGEATIFAISEDSGMCAQCDITVLYECAEVGHKDDNNDCDCDYCTVTYICKDCGRLVHTSFPDNIICLIIMFIRLFKTFVATVR